MEDSILKTTKKILGIDAAYTAFNLDIITHSNMVFTTLHDLGVGPPEGFFIESDEANWVDFELDPLQRNAVKTYVFLRVKLAFDPPQTSFHILSLEKQVQELEWRLNVRRENVAWIPPSSPSLP